MTLDQQNLREDSRKMIETVNKVFSSMGIQVEVSHACEATRKLVLDLVPKQGVRLSDVVALKPHLELSLASAPIRFDIRIGGPDKLALHIPTNQRRLVYPHDVFTAEKFTKATGDLLIPVGFTQENQPFIVDLTTLPHLMIGGQTKSGKSVFLEGMLTAFMRQYTPEYVRFILIDPKQVGLNLFENSPFLLTPYITDTHRDLHALQWLEMEIKRRLSMLKSTKTKNIKEYRAYHKKTHPHDDTGELTTDQMPYIVMVIDEAADLMLRCPRDVRKPLTVICRFGDTVGVHLVISTSRVWKDVLPPYLKTLIPSRLALKNQANNSSEWLIDTPDAVNLLDTGDGLFMMRETNYLEPIQIAFASQELVKKEVQDAQNRYPQYKPGELPSYIPECPPDADYGDDDDDVDEEVKS